MLVIKGYQLYLLIIVRKANRWRKRGLSLIPSKYGISWATYATTVLVSVYSGDGTVSIVHGGVEIGQGINTKVYNNYIIMQ